MCCAAFLVAVGTAVALAESVTLQDTPNDAAPKLSDPGADAPFDPEVHRLIDLKEITVGVVSPLRQSLSPYVRDCCEKIRRSARPATGRSDRSLPDSAAVSQNPYTTMVAGCTRYSRHRAIDSTRYIHCMCA